MHETPTPPLRPREEVLAEERAQLERDVARLRLEVKQLRSELGALIDLRRRRERRARR